MRSGFLIFFHQMYEYGMLSLAGRVLDETVEIAFCLKLEIV